VLSVLYPVASNSRPPVDDVLPDVVGTARIPLYNGLTLFPRKTQRAALYAQLCRILTIAKRNRQSMLSTLPSPSHTDRGRARGDDRASHAFLLTSDKETTKSADVAAVAIGLWRVRMYEGASGDDRGWVETPS